jgi:hypothetical protein
VKHRPCDRPHHQYQVFDDGHEAGCVYAVTAWEAVREVERKVGALSKPYAVNQDDPGDHFGEKPKTP